MARKRLIEEFDSAINDALKTRDQTKADAVRFLKAGLQRLLIDQKELSQDDEIAYLMTEAKKRREAIELYRKGQRQDLEQKEEYELALIAKYLPEQMSPEELDQVIDEVIESTGAESMRDMGKVMGAVMSRIKGRVDGKTAQARVQVRLSTK